MTDKTSFTSQPSEHLPTSSEEARSKASISDGILLLAMEVILRMAPSPHASVVGVVVTRVLLILL